MRSFPRDQGSFSADVITFWYKFNVDKISVRLYGAVSAWVCCMADASCCFVYLRCSFVFTFVTLLRRQVDNYEGRLQVR